MSPSAPFRLSKKPLYSSFIGYRVYLIGYKVNMEEHQQKKLCAGITFSFIETDELIPSFSNKTGFMEREIRKQKHS